MIVSYCARLTFLALAIFFLVNSVLGLLIRMMAPRAARWAAGLQARNAARLFFGMRLAPSVTAVLLVFGVFAPSYLLLEPAGIVERVSWVCAMLALGGAGLWLDSASRAMAALRHSWKFSEHCRKTGKATQLFGDARPVFVIEDASPILAVVGLLRPRIVVSTSVLRALSCEELDAAFAHERAHITSNENLKRLLLLLAPDLLPSCRLLEPLNRAWSDFAEWAADEQAIRGDHCRSISLAGALVRVARLGAAMPVMRLSTSLVSEQNRLAERVDRLMSAPSPEMHHRSHRRLLPLLMVLGAALGYAVLQPSFFAQAHRMLEVLIR